jgi:hypothetical protein
MRACQSRRSKRPRGSSGSGGCRSASSTSWRSCASKRRRSSEPPKRHTLNCAKCGRGFIARLRSTAYCSRGCRDKAQAEKTAERLARPQNPREAWPAEVDELTSKLARIEGVIAMEHDWTRVATLRKQLAVGTAKLERLKLEIMAGEQPAPAP